MTKSSTETTLSSSDTPSARSSSDADAAHRILRRSGAFRGIVVLSVLAGLVGVVLVYVWRTGPRSFESGAWKSASEFDRGRMVNDLRQRRLAEGRTRDELLALLGAPDRTDDQEWHYYFTADRSWLFGDWTEWIVIEFDERGTAASVYVDD